MSKIQCGDKIKVLTKTRTGWKEKECTVVEETEKFISVNYGLYPGCINKFDIKTKKVKIEKIETEENQMFKQEVKITKEQLLEECRTFGTGKEAEKAIGEKYGLAPNTIKAYINKWLTVEEKAAFKDKVDYKNEKIEKAIFSTELKESPKETKATLKLDIVGITLKGENGMYKLCKNGLELSNSGQILAFENKQQWEEFKAEIDRAFEYGKHSMVFDS